MSNIKGILIDYGGTIDTNGIHWSEIIYDGYKACNVIVAKVDFRKAYVYGEQSMEKKQALIKPYYTFKDVLQMKLRYEFEYLSKHDLYAWLTDEQAVQVADYCYSYAQKVIEGQRCTLAVFAKKYPVVLVSNFYGNLLSVLHDYGIEQYFQSVVESSIVGVRKPNPEIFRIGIERLNLKPEECVIIGDSYSNDIAPAIKLGCKSIWLKGIGWDSDDVNTGNPQADCTISTLEEAVNMFDNLK